MNAPPICMQIINGPNIQTLGLREPALYGESTYQDLERRINDHARRQNWAVSIYQSDAEHELIRYIHKAKTTADVLIVNFGAFTHTSIALRDALLFAEKPFIEVHISNIFAREIFRHKSYIADIATGVIAGMGVQGYLMAMDYFAHIFQKGIRDAQE